MMWHWLMAAALLSGPMAAQDPAARLRAVGATPEYIQQVTAEFAEAARDGLPVEPLVLKALEGWAKRDRVPVERVVTVLAQVRTRLTEGRELARGAGVSTPPDALVTAAGEALGRGLSSDDVRELVRAAPTAPEAATGLMVAASLAAQGLERAAAVRLVHDQLAGRANPQAMLELPSALADVLARGVPMSDIARQILSGGGLPGGIGGPPPGTPRGPPITPPGRGGTD